MRLHFKSELALLTLGPSGCFSFVLNICYFYLLNSLHGVLVGEHGIFDLCCTKRTLSRRHVDFSSQTRDRTQAPCIGSSESLPLDHQGHLPEDASETQFPHLWTGDANSDGQEIQLVQLMWSPAHNRCPLDRSVLSPFHICAYISK